MHGTCCASGRVATTTDVQHLHESGPQWHAAMRQSVEPRTLAEVRGGAVQRGRRGVGMVGSGCCRRRLGVLLAVALSHTAAASAVWQRRGAGGSCMHLAASALALASLNQSTVEGATPLFSSYFPEEDCCKLPNFLNPTVAPELVRCKQECRAFVQYPTKQSCQLNETCKFAMMNFDTALTLARQRLSQSSVCTADYRVCFRGRGDCLGGTCADPPAILSIACELALRKAMCAYHFPRCVNDLVTFAHEVCMETCDNVKAYCNITLDEVVAVKKCTTRNFGCLSAAPRRAGSFVPGVLVALFTGILAVFSHKMPA